jgi:hypothetical protein
MSVAECKPESRPAPANKTGRKLLMKNELCAAIEALEEFQAAHYDWPYVRKETEAIKIQLESALSRFESLLEDMKEIEKEEALA